LRPDADDTTGTWTNELGGLPLYPSVDEAPPANDSDYIQSATAPSADVCRLRLANPSATLLPPAKLRVRYQRSGSGSLIDLTVRLKQGTSTIATRTFPDIPTSLTTSTITLTGGEYSSITDFNDLFVELQADAA
jgi:hypothetical protein